MAQRCVRSAVLCLIAWIGLAASSQEPSSSSQVYLGVTMRDVDHPDVAQLGVRAERGAVLTKVWPGTPAEQAGLKAGDVIFQCGDRSIGDCAQLRAVIQASAPGNRHRVEVTRGGQQVAIDLTLGTRPANSPPSAGASVSSPQQPYLGLNVTSAGREAAHNLGIETPVGVVVLSVQPGGPAAEAGLQRGDLINEFAGQSLMCVEDFETALRRSPLRSEQVVGLIRGQAGLNMKATIGTAPAAPVQRYTSASGAYSLRLPGGWRVERLDQPDRPPERQCDKWISSEDSYRIFCFRGSRPVADREQGLKEFIREKLAEIPSGESSFRKLGKIGIACVAYYGGNPRRAVWRMAFVDGDRRYVINAEGPPLAELNALPGPLAEVLDSLEVVSVVPGETVQGTTQPTTPTATPPVAPSPVEVPPIVPPGWVTQTRAGVTVSFPPDWKSSSLAAADEGLWCLGAALSPVASFSVVRDTPIEEIARGIVRPDGKTRLGATECERYSVERQRGERLEKGVLVVVPRGTAVGGSLTLAGFAPADKWEQYGPLLTQILSCVRLDAKGNAGESSSAPP